MNLWACLSFPVVFSVVVEPETGRVIIPHHSVNEPDLYLRDRVFWQLVLDDHNRAVTPDRHNLWAEQTEIGKIILLKFIHAGHYSTVFTIADFPEWLIKFQADCRTEGQTHPLIADFIYMKETNAHGISPKPHFVSPPSLLCEEKKGKCGFTMSDAEFSECRENNGTLRYMIMDRAEGMSLYAFRRMYFERQSGAIGLRNAAVMGAKLIDLLEISHTRAHVVHGDIHTPNVMVKTDPVTNVIELQLIDFGLAFHKSERALPTKPVRESGEDYHELHSIWQVLGYEWSARDDLLDALQSIAHLMQPFQYAQFEKRIADEGMDHLIEWKMRRNWFVTDLHDPVELIAEAARPILYRKLEEILQIARSLEINDPVPYSEIKGRFLEIARVSSSTPPS